MGLVCLRFFLLMAVAIGSTFTVWTCTVEALSVTWKRPAVYADDSPVPSGQAIGYEVLVGPDMSSLTVVHTEPDSTAQMLSHTLQTTPPIGSFICVRGVIARSEGEKDCGKYQITKPGGFLLLSNP